MDFKDLNRQLKENTLQSAYVFYGSEDYLKDFYQKRLTDALVDPALSVFNLNVFEGPRFSVDEFTQAVDAYPFMAEKKLLILKDTGLFTRAFKNADAIHAVETCLKDIPDYLHLLFVEESVEKTSGLFKAAGKRLALVELDFLKTPDLIAWISKQARQRGKSIDRDAIMHLIGKCDSSLYAMIRELDKLAGYLGDQETITVQHIDAIVTKSLENRIFELVDCLAAGNRQAALLLLRDLQELKEPEVKIASVISQHMINLLYTKLQLADGVPQAEIAKKLKKRDFVVRKYAAQVRGMELETLQERIERCVALDIAIKTSRYENGYFALEQFIFSAPVGKGRQMETPNH